MAPVVSICLPVHNGEQYLADAIESVLNQSFSDFELIVCDDASADSTPRILSHYAARDKRIVYQRNQAALGLFANYNECLRLSQGSFIKPFAQDDLLEPTMLEETVSVLKNNPGINLVSTARRWIAPDGAELKVVQPFPENRKITGSDVVLYNLLCLTNWVGEPSTVIFRSEAKGEGFDTSFYHYGDIEYWFRILNGAEYFYLNKVLCSFRRHSEAATTKNLSGMFFALDILRLGKKYQKFLENFGESTEHFRQRAMEVIALHLDHLVREEGLTLEQMLATVKLDDTNPSLIQDFAELSFYSTRYLTNLLAQINDLKCKQECERNWYEALLADLHNSTSWKLTAPLRTLGGLVKP